MGERVYAALELYPYNRPALAATPEGASFLAGLDSFLDRHSYQEEELARRLQRFDLDEANYGIAAMDEAGLSRLAEAAGLYYRHLDEGGASWAPRAEVWLPSGPGFRYVMATFGGAPVLTQETWERYRFDVPSDRADAYFTLASMSLVEWKMAYDDGTLNRLLDLVS